MRLKLVIELDGTADDAWATELQVDLLNRLAAPFIHIRSADGGPLPEHWTAGASIAVEGRIFGFFPMGKQAIDVVTVDPLRRIIVTTESGTILRSWRHEVSIGEGGPGHCIYSDEIDFDAGWLTAPLWPLAWAFYRHRQHRRRLLSRRPESSGVNTRP